MTIDIRAAADGDLDGIVAVFLACWRENYATVLPPALIEGMTDDGARALWSAALGRPGSRTLVARSLGGDVLGVTRFSSGGGAGTVESLYVSPTAQGLGLGARLLGAAADALAREGSTSASLWVFEANAPSLRFYERQGWRPDGEERVEAAFGEPEIRLVRALSRRDDRLQAGAAQTVSLGVPGAVLALRRGDDTLYGAAGTSNPSGGPPMDLSLSFDIASITKVLGTTTTLLRLVSDGALSLDDRVSRFVPAFSEGAKNAVTVRQLLEHRGGLTEWWPLYLAIQDDAGRNGSGRASAEAALDTLPLAYEPGAGRHYSDLGFMLLGRVIEAVTALPLPDAVEQLVLQPLGLAQTRYAHPVTAGVVASARGDEVERRMVETGVPYPVPFAVADFAAWRTGVVAGDVNDGNAFHAFGGVSGHAGLFSTVPDLLSFGLALSHARELGGLWRAEVVDGFFAASADENQALGFRRYRMALGAGGEPIDVLGHPGFTGVAFGFVPGGDTAFVIATNRLLADGEPVSNARLWQNAEPRWRQVLTEAAAPTDPLADAREES